MSDVFPIWVIEKKRNSNKLCIKQVLSIKGSTCFNRDSRCEVDEVCYPTGVTYRKGEWFKTFDEALHQAEKLLQTNIRLSKVRYEKALQTTITTEPLKFYTMKEKP